MKPLSADTASESERVLLEGYRRMPAWRKLQQVQEMNELVQQLALNDIRRQHPEASEREHRLRLAARWLEPDLLRQAFGWEAEEK